MGKALAKIVGLGWGRKTSKKVEVGVPVVQGFGRNSECGSQIQAPVLGSEARRECLGKRDWQEGEVRS